MLFNYGGMTTSYTAVLLILNDTGVVQLGKKGKKHVNHKCWFLSALCPNPYIT